MSEWKSVKDELPRDNELVLTATENEYGVKGTEYHGTYISYAIETVTYHEDGSVTWSDDADVPPDYWMPIKPLIKENEDE